MIGAIQLERREELTCLEKVLRERYEHAKEKVMKEILETERWSHDKYEEEEIA